MSGRILVVGSLNLDRTFQLAHLPVAGATQTATAASQAAGGKGANQAAAAARLGGDVAMAGAVGEDAEGRLVLAALRAAGADTSPVITLQSETGTATILLTPDGENSIVLAPGANAAFAPVHIDSLGSLFENAAIILTQLETSHAVLERTLALAAQAGVPVMLDPAPAAPLAPGIFAQIAWFTPNETEAEFYARATRAADALQGEALCRHFQRLGVANVVLKLGKRGAAMRTAEGSYCEIPAPQVQVVDTTAAGDTLNGALAVRLAAGDAPQGALRYAVAAASLATARAGAIASLPTAADVDTFRNRA